MTSEPVGRLCVALWLFSTTTPVVFDHRKARAPPVQLEVVVAAVSSPPTVGHRPTLQQGKAELFLNSANLRVGNSNRFAETLRDLADIHSTGARLAAGFPASSLVSFFSDSRPYDQSKGLRIET